MAGKRRPGVDLKRTNPLEGAKKSGLTFGDLSTAFVDGLPDVPDNALVRMDDERLMYKRFTLYPIGLDVPDDVTRAELEELGYMLIQIADVIQFAAGDWANEMHQRYGVPYDQLAEVFGWSIQTIYQYGRVCRNVPRHVRDMRVRAFSIYQEIAALPEAEQVYWVEQVAQNNWRLKDLKAAKNGTDRPAPPDEMWKTFQSFERKQMRIARRVGRQDREKLAADLRALADKIEGLG